MDGKTDAVSVELEDALLRTDAVGILVGSGHVIEFASESARELIGRVDEDLTDLDWVGITPPEYRARDDDAMREAVALGTSGWFAKQYFRPDESRVGVEILVVRLQREPFRWMALLRGAADTSLAADTAIPVAGSLLRLARRLAGTGTTDEVLTVVDRLMAPALGATYANMALLDDEDDAVLRLHHDPGADDDLRERWLSLPLTSDTLLGDAVLSRRVLVCHSLQELETRYPMQGADARRLGFSALAAAPLRARDGRIIGALGAAWKDDAVVDIDLVRVCADLVGNALALGKSIDFDRRAALSFQQMLLPAQSALGTRHDVAVRYRAVERVVGGDFYDVIERDDTSWLIVGDVVGHGLGAARTMGKVRFFIRALVASSSSPSELLRSVSLLLEDERQSETVTCLAIRHDATAGTITAATAGHPAPILVGSDISTCQLQLDPFPPLGVRSWPADRKDRELDAPPRLIAFTDGLIERRNEIIDLGIRRLVDLVDTYSDAPIDDLADILVKSELATTNDDMAVVCIQFDARGSGGPGTDPST